MVFDQLLQTGGKADNDHSNTSEKPYPFILTLRLPGAL